MCMHRLIIMQNRESARQHCENDSDNNNDDDYDEDDDEDLKKGNGIGWVQTCTVFIPLPTNGVHRK